MSRMDVALLLVLVVAIVAVGYILGPWGCEARWDIETDWSITTGCRVMSMDGFVPEGNYRVLE